MKTTTAIAFLSLALCCSSAAYADTFGSGDNTFDIEFVTIGNPGNPADTGSVAGPPTPNPVGSVSYEYRIGKFEISEGMIDKANAETSTTANPLNITHDGRGANKPATSISWFQAAQFINWLNTSTGNTPAYKFGESGNFQLWQLGDAGYNPDNLFRNSQTQYFLPSVDEWFKAAYYDPTSGVYYDYPTGSNTPPTAVASGTTAGTAVRNQNFFADPADITQAGGLSPYGTMGQGGNVYEWEETENDLLNDSLSSSRGMRGGAWLSDHHSLTAMARSANPPNEEYFILGFRVASIFGAPVIGDPILPGTDHSFENHSGHDHSYDDLSFTILQSVDFSYADLSFSDLSNAVLYSSDFSHANLNSANLNTASFDSTILNNSDLRNTNSSQAITDTSLRSAADISGVNLSGNDMSGFNLSNTNLSSSNLSGANLSSANLNNTNLSSADLTNTNLGYADLRNSNTLQAVSDTQLQAASTVIEVNLSGNNMSGYDLSNLNLNGANLVSTDLSAANLHNTNLRNDSVTEAISATQLQSAADVTGVDLSDNDMSGFNLSNTNLSSSNLSGANLSSANLNNTNLSSADLTNTNLGYADLRNSNTLHAISDMQLRAASNVMGVNLNGNDLSGYDLSNLNLSGANLSDSNFNTVNIDSTNLNNSDLRNTNSSQAITAIQLRSAANITGVNLSGNDVSGFNLSDLNLSGANFDSANLNLTDFSGVNLTDATLTTKILPTVNFSGSNLSGASLGDPALIDGFVYEGNLDFVDGTTTLNSLGFANLGAITILSNATLVAANGILIGSGDTLLGNGQVDGKISASSGTLIQANGNLILGDATSFNGFASEGELLVGSHIVTLHDANPATLGSSTEIGSGGIDGTLLAPNGILMGGGKTLTGHGSVNAKIAQSSNSTISATGNLTLGDGGSFTGFSSSGELYVNVHTVTLYDRDKAVLGSLTEIGSGGVGGTLSAPNGILLEDGKVLVGQGTVNTGSDEFKNEGLVQGDGTGISFNHLVTGEGNFGGNVTFSGSYTPGGDPTLIELENVTFGSTNNLMINIGGLERGTEYVALDVSGTASLGGSLSGSLVDLGGGTFVPFAGDSFEVLTAAGGINGTFDGGISLPPLTGDLFWDVVYDTENNRVLLEVLTQHTDDPLTWDQIGPGTFGYETSANWTPSATPTADNDVIFPLDGNVDVVLFSTSVAQNITFSDGVVRLKSLGATIFTSHGNVTVDDLLATNLAGGAFATLDGTNGHTWTTSLDLQVGNAGFGTFIVNNGGQFDAQQILVGNQAGAEGEVTVTGFGSTVVATLNTDTSLYRIGFAGGTGTMNVQDGALVFSSALIGDVSLGEGLGSTGTLNVDGLGSSVLTDDLLVGFGGVGFMNITAGGLVDQIFGSDPDAQVASGDLPANVGAGTVVVNGDVSRWNFRNGEFGSTGLGTVAVEAGGRIAATENITVGLSSTSQGSLNVTGNGTLADSLVSVGGDLVIGELGQGTLTVDLGGDVTVDDDMFIGTESGNLNNNIVTITNPGSSVAVADRLEVGRGGNGTLDITDSGTASASNLNVGELPSGNGTMMVSGSNSSFTAHDALVGIQGTGSLTISGDAHFESRRFWVGFNGVSEGTVDVSGIGSTLSITEGGDLVSLRIGGHTNDDGGTGTVTISEGGKIISNKDTSIGGNSSSVGSLTVTGLTSLADFNDGGMDDVTVVGYAGEGTLSILNGGRVESEIAMIGQLAGATGTADVGDGNDLANWNVGGSLYVGGSDTEAGGTGLLNINSQGTVTVADELKIWNDGKIYFNSETATLSVGALTFGAGSQFVFQKGNLVLTGGGLNINASGPLGDSVSMVTGQTLSTTAGGLVNEGDLNVIGTTVSFTGGPSVNNTGAEVNAINATLTFDGDLTNNGDVNLINTTVNGSLINGGTGTLAMIGVNSFSDNLQFGAQDNLYVDISGPNPGEYDSLTVGGETELAGNLNVSFVHGFSPSAGDTIDILTAAGGILDTFAEENLPVLVDDLQWFVHYETTSLTLVSTLAADFNENGYVDGDDLTDWKAGFSSPDAAHKQGDADGDSDTDGNDFLIWQRQVGSGVAAATSSNATVPEPSTLLLSLLGLSAVGICCRCNRKCKSHIQKPDNSSG